MTIHYYILDTETTGTKAGHHEIFQISILRASDGAQLTKNIAVENPDRASHDALRITGKTKTDIQIGEPKLEVIEACNEFLEEDKAGPAGRCIVAHNAAFDKRFCHAEWISVKRKFPADLWLCTIAFTKKYAKREGFEKIAKIQGIPGKKPKFGLDMSLKALDIIPKPGAHSAPVDCINTKELFDRLMDENLSHVTVIKNQPHNFVSLDNFDLSDYE